MMMRNWKTAGGVLLLATSIGMGCTDSDDHDHDHSMGGGTHDHDAGEHDHSVPIEVAAENAPSISVEAIPDGHTFNLKLTIENFIFAPENASTAHMAGEGHAHLYVDGVKVTRLYGPWFHLSGLSEGEHEVRVELSANSHNALAVDGELIDAAVTIDVPEPGAAHAHEHLMVTEVPLPSVELTVVKDPKSGWNVHAVPMNFKLTPENVSGDHVDGEGHMHLYAGDVKLARMYGEWFYVGALELGDNVLRAELATNDHRTLMAGGAPIDASTTVTVADDESHIHAGGASGDHDH